MIKILSAFLLLAVPLFAAPSGAPPASVTKEGDLVVLTLTTDAEKSLRLKTVAVEKRTLPDTRLFAGEVVTPLAGAGNSVAPVLGGTLDEVLRLADLQAAADGRVLQAQVQVDAAKIAVERAEKVLKAEAGSVRSVDEAKAGLSTAEAEMETAQAQRDLLGTAVGQSGKAKRAWVRVAVYSGESALLNSEAEAMIRSLSASSGGQSAAPVAGPPTANAATNTVDWYYQLPAETEHRAGERVAVEIPTRESTQEALVLPFSAVLHDIHGGQWVYQRTGEHTYTRHRIQVERVAGDLAVISSGPPVGTQVVTDGSAELFGTEFMTGK